MFLMNLLLFITHTQSTSSSSGNIENQNLISKAFQSVSGFNSSFFQAKGSFIYSNESVNEGHPDKICDQVSDAILDACLEQDPESKVACKTCTKTNMVMVFGEITTKATVNYEKIVRDICRDIGFMSDDVGLDADKCNVLVNIEQQSPDIAQGVHGHLSKRPEEIGAGDQGRMFGYATDETPELMPLTHVLATKIGAKLTEVRKNKTCPWVRPDGKTQVTVEYKNDNGAMVPIRVHTILISTQHEEGVTNEKIAADLKEHVIKPVVPAEYLDDKTIFHLPPRQPPHKSYQQPSLHRLRNRCSYEDSRTRLRHRDSRNHRLRHSRQRRNPTDLPHVVPNLKFNAEANAGFVGSSGGNVTFAPLRWGDAADVEVIGREFDVIVASDVVYHDHLYEPLIETLRLLLVGKKIVFVMAHMKRWKKECVFFKKARKHFCIDVLHVDAPCNGSRVGVVVYRFVGKG